MQPPEVTGCRKRPFARRRCCRGRGRGSRAYSLCQATLLVYVHLGRGPERSHAETGSKGSAVWLETASILLDVTLVTARRARQLDHSS